jgi:transcriptional regulator with XRE-family HTH domain
MKWKIANEFFVTGGFLEQGVVYWGKYQLPWRWHMELGQRIKQARLAAGLSQRQLCGDTITRNMLSLIESGRAKPSMDTLSYLASRLGKPMGYFLEEDAVLSPNQKIIADARDAYTQGNFRDVLTELENYTQPDVVFDAERFYLEALAAMALAEQAVNQGKSVYALSLLEQAGTAGQQSAYYTEDTERRRLLLCYRAAPGQAGILCEKLPELTEELLLRGRAALDGGEAEHCAQILDAATRREESWYLLRGQAAMALGEYGEAAGYLHQAEEGYPRQVIPALERCYRELEDYKKAYAYACKQKV